MKQKKKKKKRYKKMGRNRDQSSSWRTASSLPDSQFPMVTTRQRNFRAELDNVDGLKRQSSSSSVVCVFARLQEGRV